MASRRMPRPSVLTTASSTAGCGPAGAGPLRSRSSPERAAGWGRGTSPAGVDASRSWAPLVTCRQPRWVSRRCSRLATIPCATKSSVPVVTSNSRGPPNRLAASAGRTAQGPRPGAPGRSRRRGRYRHPTLLDLDPCRPGSSGGRGDCPSLMGRPSLPRRRLVARAAMVISRRAWAQVRSCSRALSSRRRCLRPVGGGTYDPARAERGRHHRGGGVEERA